MGENDRLHPLAEGSVLWNEIQVPLSHTSALKQEANSSSEAYLSHEEHILTKSIVL